MRRSKYTQLIVDYVRAHPGCCKYDVARRCTRHPLRDPSKQYYLVNTAIRAGWIVARWSGRGYALYVQGEAPWQVAPAAPRAPEAALV